MRSITRLALVGAVAFGLFASAGTPSWAGTAGAGTVAGTVTISPGLNMSSNGQVQDITFAPIALTGTFVPADPSKAFTGGITTSIVKASSSTEWTAMGAGVVNAFTFDETTPTGSIVNGKCNAGGRYQRVGSVVVVNLVCSATINGSLFTGGVTVIAQFTPTAGDGISTRITAANFTGSYVAG